MTAHCIFPNGIATVNDCQAVKLYLNRIDGSSSSQCVRWKGSVVGCSRICRRLSIGRAGSLEEVIGAKADGEADRIERNLVILTNKMDDGMMMMMHKDATRQARSCTLTGSRRNCN